MIQHVLKPIKDTQKCLFIYIFETRYSQLSARFKSPTRRLKDPFKFLEGQTYIYRYTPKTVSNDIDYLGWGFFWGGINDERGKEYGGEEWVRPKRNLGR